MTLPASGLMDTLLALPALPVQGAQLRPRGRKRSDAVWHLKGARWWISEATRAHLGPLSKDSIAPVETVTPP